MTACRSPVFAIGGLELNCEAAHADSNCTGEKFRVEVEAIALKETPMHDFLVGVVFMAIVIGPCAVALTVRLDDHGSKYDR